MSFNVKAEFGRGVKSEFSGIKTEFGVKSEFSGPRMVRLFASLHCINFAVDCVDVPLTPLISTGLDPLACAQRLRRR